MKILTSTTIIHGVENEIRKHIKNVIISMPPVGDPPRPQPPRVLPLNIFTEMGETDPITGATLLPTGTDFFPYIFIREDRQRTGGENGNGRTRFANGIERLHYVSYIFITYYIASDPFNRSQIPRLMEELRAMEFKLSRVLEYLEIWDGLVETVNNRPSFIDETSGVLHYFISVPYYEDTEKPIHEKVEELNQKVNFSKIITNH